MSTQTPIYDQLAAEGWDPSRLRPPFDLARKIEWSYECAMVHARLRDLIAHRKHQRKGHIRRLTPLP